MKIVMFYRVIHKWLTKSLGSLLGLGYNLEAGKSVFFLMMFRNFEIVSSKVPKSFMYFSNFRGILMLKFWKYEIYIENQGVNKRKYCFAIISATKDLSS